MATCSETGGILTNPGTVPGKEAYVDLTDVAMFPCFLQTVAAELQRRLELPYQPELRHMSEVGNAR